MDLYIVYNIFFLFSVFISYASLSCGTLYPFWSTASGQGRYFSQDWTYFQGHRARRICWEQFRLCILHFSYILATWGKYSTLRYEKGHELDMV